MLSRRFDVGMDARYSALGGTMQSLDMVSRVLRLSLTASA